MPEEEKCPSKLHVSFRSFFEFNITPEERKETITRLIEESRADNAFYVMLFLSTLISVSGLLMDDIVVVLGGMLVAPLLTPILSLGMAMATTHAVSFKRSFNIIVKSVALIFSVSVIAAIFFNFPSSVLETSKEILIRSSTTMTSLFVALIAGLAAAFAWAKPKLSAALPGVAVAASILPPLVVSGIGAAYLQRDLFLGSLQLFLANIIITILASLTVFSIFGFFTVRKEEEKKIKEEEKKIKEEKIEIEEKIKKEEAEEEKLEKEIKKAVN